MWNDTIEIIDFYYKIQLTPYQINTVRLTSFDNKVTHQIERSSLLAPRKNNLEDLF